MSGRKVGNCLHLYLQHFPLLSALEEDDELPSEVRSEEELLTAFRERASEQAAAVLESMHSGLFGSSSPIPYRTDRRSQRRTVRQYWYMEGRVYRSRERIARAYWNLHLGAMTDKGPVLSFIMGPQDPSSTLPMEGLASKTAQKMSVSSADPRDCFTHETGYESGVVAAFVELAADLTHEEAANRLAESIVGFFKSHRDDFEEALDA